MHTSEQRIFVVTNYIRTIALKRFRDRDSPTKMTIWENVKKYKTKRSSINLNKDCSGRRGSERT